MNIVIAGGTGLIGSGLVKKLSGENHHIYILTRNSAKKTNSNKITYVNWLNSGDQPEKKLQDIDAFINLAGETINSRWTKEQKEKILISRLDATNNCIDLIKKLNKRPNVFLNASAIGFYGTSLENTYTEDSRPGNDFLATVVKKWEEQALKARDLEIRTVLLRFGVVLANNGGALQKMILPYKLFAGGNLGSGKQWLSWIHITDAIKMILFALENENIQGPMNITTAEPQRMKQFGKAVGAALNKPHWLPTPSFALKLLLGEMSMLVLEGQRVEPIVALTNGFQYSFPKLEDALNDLL